MTKAKIEQSGQQTVADYLKQASLQLLWRRLPASGSSFQSQSTVGLRGLGSRAHPGPAERQAGGGLPPTMGGTSINLNTIPMAAVERVEVNLDGGSAIYGSDAIGGVINVVLKEGYEGLTFQGRLGSPTEEGGDEKSGSMVAGINGEKGSLMAVYEHDKKDVIYSRDRDYLAKQGNDAPAPMVATWKGSPASMPTGIPSGNTAPGRATNADGTCKNPSSGSRAAATSTMARSRPPPPPAVVTPST